MKIHVCVAYFCADLCCATDREGEDVLFGHCSDDGCLTCFQPSTNLFTTEKANSEHSPHCGLSLKTATLPKPDIQDRATHRHLHLLTHKPNSSFCLFWMSCFPNRLQIQVRKQAHMTIASTRTIRWTAMLPARARLLVGREHAGPKPT